MNDDVLSASDRLEQKKEKQLQRSDLDKERFEVTEVFKHAERARVQLSLPLLHFLLRQTNWVGLL